MPSKAKALITRYLSRASKASTPRVEADAVRGVSTISDGSGASSFSHEREHEIGYMSNFVNEFSADSRSSHNLDRKSGWHAARRLSAAGLLTGVLAASAWLVAGGTPTPAAAQGAACPNAEFRVGPSAGLPDCRAYELVTTEDMLGNQLTASAFIASFQASESGDGIVYPSSAGFGDTEAVGMSDWYRAEREGAGGWASESITFPLAPQSAYNSPLGLAAVSRDLSRVVGASNVDEDGRPLEEPDGQPSGTDTSLLLRRATGGFDLLFRRFNDGAQTIISIPIQGDDDLNPMYFSPGSFQGSLPSHTVYRVDDGNVSIASVLPDGSPTEGTLSANGQRGLTRVSDNGEVLYFSVGETNSSPIYRAEDGLSALVTASENPPATNGDAIFRTTNDDGSRAFFTSTDQLVPADVQTSTDLYVYEHSDDPEGDENLRMISVDAEPTDGSTANVQGLLGSNDAGTTVYFVANGQLVPGEPTTATRKIYRWQDGPGNGTITYLGGLSTSDSAAWANTPARVSDDMRPARVSADGRYLMVFTQAPLTADDNGNTKQVYVYDSQLQEWACASCDVIGGAAPSSPASLGRTTELTVLRSYHQVRNLAADGRVFFETGEALVDADVNGELDVYQWHAGEVSLLSSGRSPKPSFLADASADGSNVFIATHEQLTTADEDPSADLYSARIGGGLLAPEPPPVDCEGDACQGLGGSAPDDEKLGSDIVGPGNPTPSGKPRNCNRFLNKALKKRERASKAKSKMRAKKLRKKAKKLKRKAKRCERRQAS